MWENEAEETIGSEWIYSDESGEMRRVNTRDMDLQTTHYGKQGNPITLPDY
jgi:hypothetical protein